jgi:hypothetical protein
VLGDQRVFDREIPVAGVNSSSTAITSSTAARRAEILPNRRSKSRSTS